MSTEEWFSRISLKGKRHQKNYDSFAVEQSFVFL